MVDDKIYVYLIVLSSMCAGAKGDYAKRIMKHDPSIGKMKNDVSNLLEEKILF
jgi:hypothetical protein